MLGEHVRWRLSAVGRSKKVVMRRTTGWRCIGVLMLLVAGCSSGSPAATKSPTTTSSGSAHGNTWSVVALGDSVPAGSACDCTPYPQLSASDLSVPGLREVSADNRAVGGYTTTDVIRQLTQNHEVIEAVKQSDAVELEVGANDIAYSTKCGTTVDCYTPGIPELEQNLRAIVQQVDELTAGRPMLVVLLDYWSVWLGGQYAQAKGQAYVDAAATVTGEVNAAIKTVAGQTKSGYVDLRAAFKGPDYSYDETHYLASDGDHPNAEGHQKIASALEQVIAAELHLPPS
jgi:lysophospholipase L1-like esterase